MSPSSIQKELQEKPGHADASAAAGWQIVQRGVTYTVTVNECSVDDPKDGYGVHENAFKENPFCTESSTTGTEDSQPEDLKRITVDVTWTALGRKPDVHQVETLTAAGVSPGLAASGLHLETPVISPNTEPTISEQPASNSLTFAVSAPSSTVSMRWSLEGVAQSTAPAKSSGTTWTFSWAIPYPSVSDGTYTISVQAIDATGILGPPVSIPVTLVRGVPTAPKPLKGGFNTVNVSGTPTKVVELEWGANTERNVIGYRVYNPTPSLVCPENLTITSVVLSCIDFSPSSWGTAQTYSAAALYRNSKGELKEGEKGTLKLEGGPPEAPKPPTGFTATKNEDGSVTLKWTLPASGPAISFFRIYRSGTNYTNRYDVSASGSSTSYVDDNAATVHSYWITAVRSSLTESSFVGPATA
jgi:hypothetical protein